MVRASVSALVLLLLCTDCLDICAGAAGLRDIEVVHAGVLRAYSNVKKLKHINGTAQGGAENHFPALHTTSSAVPKLSRKATPGQTDIGSGMRTQLTARAQAKVSMMQREGLTSCSLRLHGDIAESISAEVMELARTGLVSLLIDGIVILVTIIVVAVTVIFLLATANDSGSVVVQNFIMTINPAVISVVWPLMENDATMNLVDSVTSALMNAVSAKLRYRLTVTVANYLSDITSKALYTYIMEEELPVLAAGVSHRVLHAVVLDLTRSLTRSLTHTIPRYVRGVLGKNTVRLFYCVYCYREGQFCTYCFSWQSFGDAQKTKSMEPDMFMVKTE